MLDYIGGLYFKFKSLKKVRHFVFTGYKMCEKYLLVVLDRSGIIYLVIYVENYFFIGRFRISEFLISFYLSKRLWLQTNHILYIS